MTMPHERTRALIWAGDFLREIQNSDKVPTKVREQARIILRHYPSTSEISEVASRMAEQDDWFGPWLSLDDGYDVTWNSVSLKWD